MIPKTIHYFWMSDGPLPPQFKGYIEGWRRLMPDYEIKQWDRSNFPEGRSVWVDEAIRCRKYAFAADYIRNYALYHEGGIYMDVDVEALKSFDPFLRLPYFFCFECGTGNLESAIMGTEAGNPFYQRMLEYYDSRHFLRGDGTMDMLPIPKIFLIANPGYRIRPIDSIEDFDPSPGVLSVLPHHYFSPIDLETRRMTVTDQTVTIHRFAGTWQPWSLKLKKRVKYLLGARLTGWIIRTKRRVRRLF